MKTEHQICNLLRVRCGPENLLLTEAGISGHEGYRVHLEDRIIDAVITLACRRIKRSLRPGAFLGVPRASPRLNALFQLADDAVGKFLHYVGALGNLPFAVLDESVAGL